MAVGAQLGMCLVIGRSNLLRVYGGEGNDCNLLKWHMREWNRR